jgi:Na+/H+-translocating membrane pyrophosphatase
MVVAQIETPPAKAITKGLWWLCAVTILAILTGTFIYFGEYITTMVKELRSLVYYFIAISGLVLIIMLLIDQYKTYNRKMKLLDMP